MSYSITNGETLVATHSGVYTYNGAAGGSFTLGAGPGVTADVNVGILVNANLIAYGGTIDDADLSGPGSKVAVTIGNGGSFITGGLLSASETTINFTTGGGQAQLGFGAANIDFAQFFNQIDVNSFGAGDSIQIDGLLASPGEILGLGWVSTSVSSTTNSSHTTDETIAFKDALGIPIDTFTINNVAQGEHLVAVGTGQDLCGTFTDTLIECVCFLPGTHIATSAGERRVEDLQAGDLVRTNSGKIARVKWVGYRTVDTRTLRNPELAMPVRITAGAISEGIPQRDLRVTPEHAVLVDGHLIPARLLVNGTTIRLDRLEVYSFFHVELEEHDILVAEGLGAESYLDTGNRRMFANNGVVELFKETTEASADDYNSQACMPLTLDPPTTGAVWQSIASRAAELGHGATLPATTQEPELAVFAGSLRLRPVYVDGRRATFALPAGADAITVASRASMPWSVHPWMDDRRRLGVAIDRIVVRGADDVREIALDSPAIGHGWWGAEMASGRSFRWTDGAAEIALPHMSGPAMLEISLHATATHTLPEQAANAAAQAPVALAG